MSSCLSCRHGGKNHSAEPCHSCNLYSNWEEYKSTVDEPCWSCETGNKRIPNQHSLDNYGVQSDERKTILALICAFTAGFVTAVWICALLL